MTSEQYRTYLTESIKTGAQMMYDMAENIFYGFAKITTPIIKGVMIFYEYGSELLCRGLYEVDQKEISVDTYIYHTESSFCRRTVYA